VDAWLAHEHHIRSLGPLGFDDAYTLAVKRSFAEQRHLRTLRDLARVSRDLSMGADYEFLGRPEWSAVKATYGLELGRTATYDPSLLYDAVARGDVDVISAFTSDGRIAADDLVCLEDPDGALPSYDAMVLLGPHVADDARVVCALSGLHVSEDAMRRANALVDHEHRSPAVAARSIAEGAAVPDCTKVAP
jgi:osmoprotectant transport system permease protein